MKATSKDLLFEAIGTAICTGCKEFLAAFRQDWPGEQMYAFFLEVSSEGNCVFADAATEEGLQRIAEKYQAIYRAKDGETLPLLRTQLRWGSPEDGWYANNAAFFDEANRLLAQAHESGFMKMYDGKLREIALQCLRELDHEQIFGAGTSRKQVTICICNTGGDNSEQELFGWADQVNPPDVMEKLRQEVAEVFEAGKRIVSRHEV